MTKLESIELLYNQFLNLSDEIKNLIENEEYEEVLVKLDAKDNLIMKIKNARKTVESSEENKQILETMDKKLMEKDQENLEFSTKIHKALGEELKNANKKVKVNTAYTIQAENESGTYVNIEE